MKNTLIIFLVLVTVASLSAAAYLYGKTQSNSAPNQMVKVTPSAAMISSSPAVSPTVVAEGTVTGKMCYPASILPIGKIVAKNTTTNQLTIQDYPGNLSTFTFKLPPGTYHMKYDAYVSGLNGAHLSGYYTSYSSCVGNPSASDCSGQKTRPLLPVVVESGKTDADVNLCDFYYPQDSPPNF